MGLMVMRRREPVCSSYGSGEEEKKKKKYVSMSQTVFLCDVKGIITNSTNSHIISQRNPFGKTFQIGNFAAV